MCEGAGQHRAVSKKGVGEMDGWGQPEQRTGVDSRWEEQVGGAGGRSR